MPALLWDKHRGAANDSRVYHLSMSANCCGLPDLRSAGDFSSLLPAATIDIPPDGLHLPADFREDVRESDVSAQGHQDLSRRLAWIIRGAREMSGIKVKCDECDWRGTEDQLLRAQNPFADDNETMVGCPTCREPNSMIRACDHENCWSDGSCGTPTANGYATTCYYHKPPAVVIGKVTGARYDGEQVPGIPGAICHACGLKDYPCTNPDCPKGVELPQADGGAAT